MDTNIYIACLLQVVAFAPKVIIIACLRQVVAFAPKVIFIACLRQVVAFAPKVIKMRRLRRRTREGRRGGFKSWFHLYKRYVQ
jgi:hypothetical protein